MKIKIINSISSYHSLLNILPHTFIRNLLLTSAVLFSTSLCASISVSVNYGSYQSLSTMTFGNIDTVTLGYYSWDEYFIPLHSTDVTDGPAGTRIALGFYEDNDFAFSSHSWDTPVLQLRRGQDTAYMQSSQWGPITLATSSSSPSQSNIVHFGTDTSNLIIYGAVWVESNSLGGLDAFFIPEPSTYALIFGGLALGFVAIRRK